ncbi:13731_t:CDS:2, partial [Dentiscutata heterogama]
FHNKLFNQEDINLTNEDIEKHYGDYKMQKVFAHAQIMVFISHVEIWSINYNNAIKNNSSTIDLFTFSFINFPWYFALPPIIAFTMIRG